MPTRENTAGRVLETVKILVAGDDEELYFLLRLILGQETDLVLIGRARTGGELLALISDSPPDVVLLDLDAPGPAMLSAISGMAALSMPRVRVVGLAGNLDAIDVLVGLVDDLLLKQDSLDRLPAALRRPEPMAPAARAVEEEPPPVVAATEDHAKAEANMRPAPAIEEPGRDGQPEVPAASGTMNLTVGQFSSFRSLAAFQQALEGLAGVRPKSRSFHRGTLYATIQYDGAIPLAERLRGLDQFNPMVVARRPGSIEVRIDSGD